MTSGSPESRPFGCLIQTNCIVSGPDALFLWKLSMLTTVSHGLRGPATISGNLLPAHRNVNQNQKRDRLPGVELLRSAQDRSNLGGTKAIWVRTITCFLVGS